MHPTASWTICCRVVDHYGDIGIAWRLAKQLTDEGRAVRLVVDDLASFAHFEPRVVASRSTQRVGGIDIATWSSMRDAPDLTDVVVELLGCGLPDAMLAAMTRAARRPLWIDYEYLSAEDWVDDFHAKPSPHPKLPLVKHFFYPGFGRATGGLLVEPGLLDRRAAFVADPRAVEAFRLDLGIAGGLDRRYASLFAYPHAPAAVLLDALTVTAAIAGSAWTVVVPNGVLVDAIGAWRPPPDARVTVKRVPFLDQDGYDRLLWSCDFNAVRGEDSFVRAQLAGRPFVWQIYPQADDAHRAKLAAFDARFGAVLAPEARRARDAWSLAWNGFGPLAAASEWLRTLAAQQSGAEGWRGRLAVETPLVHRLLAFAEDRQPSP